MQSGEYRNVILRRDKENCEWEMTQKRTSCLSTNPLEPKRLPLDVRDAARHLHKEAISESGLLRFIPSVSIANVRLRLGPDNQPHIKPA